LATHKAKQRSHSPIQKCCVTPEIIAATQKIIPWEF